jgi:hypothetical protein
LEHFQKWGTVAPLILKGFVTRLLNNTKGFIYVLIFTPFVISSDFREKSERKRVENLRSKWESGQTKPRDLIFTSK